MDISPLDVINIGMLTRRVLSLLDYRRALHVYLLSKMDQVAPNLAALVGELVGARLISHAGSLTSLAKYPASTVQILGCASALRLMATMTHCSIIEGIQISHRVHILNTEYMETRRLNKLICKSALNITVPYYAQFCITTCKLTSI